MPTAHQARVSLALRHFPRTSSNRLFCTALPNISESSDVEIRHYLPRMFTGNGQNFLGKHLPSQTHQLNSLVAGDGWSPECRGESVSHRPMVRSSHTCLWERLAVSPGIVTTRSLGSGSCLGLVSGGSRAKYPTREAVAANCSSARWQRFLEDTAVTAAGFSVATMA